MYSILNPQIAFLFFRKTSESEKFLTEKEQKDATDFSRVRCPLCRWQPTASSMWFCSDCGYPEYFFGGCGMFWNTFETRGKCPGCGHQWKFTSCLRCGVFSPHEEWYDDGEKD